MNELKPIALFESIIKEGMIDGLTREQAEEVAEKMWQDNKKPAAIVESNLGKIFYFLCKGKSKASISNNIGIHKSTLGLKLKQFKESDVNHSDIIIKELKKYEDSLK